MVLSTRNRRTERTRKAVFIHGAGPSMEVTETIRASEWWESKLSPIFATIYATIFLIDTSLFSAWPILLLAFAALVPGAAYVSVINDVTDLEEDRVSGKRNRHADKSRIY